MSLKELWHYKYVLIKNITVPATSETIMLSSNVLSLRSIFTTSIIIAAKLPNTGSGIGMNNIALKDPATVPANVLLIAFLHHH